MHISYDLCYIDGMKADAVLNIRVPAEVKDALARAAETNLRTTSSMAVWALSEWLSEHGHLDREKLTTARAASKRSRK